MRLLLVRHGESICGLNGIVGGPKGCTGLTERGIAQAEALRDSLVADDLRPDVVMTSTLPRAMQTGDIIAGAWGHEVARSDELVEWVPGEIDGTLWEDWRAAHGDYDMNAEPDRPLSPGGEGLNAFRSRVRGALERLASESDGRTVLVSTHGGVIVASIKELFESGWTLDRPQLQPDFTSVTEWRRSGGTWHLVRYNDTSHLRGTGLLG